MGIFEKWCLHRGFISIHWSGWIVLQLHTVWSVCFQCSDCVNFRIRIAASLAVRSSCCHCVCRIQLSELHWWSSFWRLLRTNQSCRACSWVHWWCLEDQKLLGNRMGRRWLHSNHSRVQLLLHCKSTIGSSDCESGIRPISVTLSIS